MTEAPTQGDDVLLPSMAGVGHAFESWAPIPGYEGLYEVSNLGAVRVLARLVDTPRGASYWRPALLMSPSTRPDGRRRISLTKNGAARNYYVHLLVLLAFKGECPEGMEGCHNDGDPSNNALENLRYDTPVANADDRRRHGTCFGRRYARLKIETVVAIKRLAADGRSLNSVARELGVDHSTVRKIATGKRRAEVVVA